MVEIFDSRAEMLLPRWLIWAVSAFTAPASRETVFLPALICCWSRPIPAAPALEGPERSAIAQAPSTRTPSRASSARSYGLELRGIDGGRPQNACEADD